METATIVRLISNIDCNIQVNEKDLRLEGDGKYRQILVHTHDQFRIGSPLRSRSGTLANGSRTSTHMRVFFFLEGRISRQAKNPGLRLTALALKNHRPGPSAEPGFPRLLLARDSGLRPEPTHHY